MLLRNAWHALGGKKGTSAILIMEKYLCTKSRSIVQIGANDGVSGDPLFALANRYRNWKLLLVEPVPYLFEELKRNYGNDARFAFENAAISPEGKPLTFHTIKRSSIYENGGLDRIYNQIGSFDKDHLIKLGGIEIEPHIEAIEVECMSLAELLRKHHLVRIDALLVDAEGYDWKVIQQLDLDIFKPSIIYFEHSNLSSSEKEAAISFVRDYYDIFQFGINYLCIKSKLVSKADLKQLRKRRIYPCQKKPLER